MAENQFFPAVDGQEIAIPDYQGLGVVSGLADDRTIAEFLRLYMCDGTNIAKAIMPYGFTSIPGNNATLPATPTQAGNTVLPTSSANGSVLVNPFRAFIGSRAAAPALTQWRDIRSAVFVGPSAMQQTIPLPSNATGSTQWCLVYVLVNIDSPAGTTTRREKNAATGVVTANTVQTVLSNNCIIQTTPLGSGGALPTIAADAPGFYYNVPLAYVRVPNGFNASSTVLARDIRDAIPLAAMPSPTSGLTRTSPASGNNDQDGTYAADSTWQWSATGGTRPAIFLPPSMVGCEARLIQVDAGMKSAGHYSHASGSVVDSSTDWRNRFVIAHWAMFTSGGSFGTDPTAGGGIVTLPYGGPNVVAPNNSQGTSRGNTMYSDAQYVTNSATVWALNGNGSNGLAGGVNVALYTLNADGILRWFQQGAPTNGFWFWLMASGQYPNF